MSYGTHYKILFKNRDNDQVEIRILEKDYTDTAVVELQAGGSPFTLEYQSGDEDILIPIRGSVAKFQYFNKGGYPLTTFASTADDKFKIEVYVTSSFGTYLYWTGYLVQDECSEDFMPVPNLVTLTATDNLGLLKDIRLNTALVTLYTKLPATAYFERLFLQTGLELEVEIYCNVFENGMSDRAIDAAFEPFSQFKLNTKTFIQSETEWDDCYTTFEKILAAWKCTLFQAEGRWIIMRWPELKYFSNAIQGTRYTSAFASPQAVTFNKVRTIGKGYPIYPINANQVKSIVRPNKYTRLQYNYEQPYKLIPNDDLLVLGDLISSTTVGNIRYDRYEPEYWLTTNSVPCYIQVETDISLAVPLETNRYLVVEYLAPANPALTARRTAYPSQIIEVNEGDRFDFSVSFRGETGTNDSARHGFSIYLAGNSGTYYALTQSGSSSPYTLQWNAQGGSPAPPTYVGNGLIYGLANTDLTEWRTHNIFQDTDETLSPRFPEDGDLYIFLWGFNNSNGTTTPHANIKDIRFTYYPYVNDSTLVIGHIHKSVQNETVKKTYESTIFVDDSPKNNLRGAMFLDDGTTKTAVWHHAGSAADYQFGFIQKTDILFITDSFRKRIEGDFRGLKDNSSYLFSLLNVFEFDTLAGSYFILGQCRFDLMRCEFSGTLEEIWNTAEVYDSSVFDNTFTYIYRTQ